MKRRWKMMMAALVAGMLLTGCSSMAPSEEPRSDTKPAEVTDGGWTKVFLESEGPRIFKRCDGTTLIYRGYYSESGVAVVPNSPECTKPEASS